MEAITRTFFLHHAWTQSTGIPPSASLGLALGPRGRPVPAAPPNPTVRTVHSYSVPLPPAGCTPLHTHHRALVEGSIPGPRPLWPGLRTLLDPCWTPAGPLLDPAGPLLDPCWTPIRTLQALATFWTLDVCCLRVCMGVREPEVPAGPGWGPAGSGCWGPSGRLDPQSLHLSPWTPPCLDTPPGRPAGPSREPSRAENPLPAPPPLVGALFKTG